MGRRARWITSQVALSPKKSVFIGEGCWRRGGGGPQSGRPLLRPRDPAAAQIADVRRNNFAEGDRARSGARKRHLVIGAVHGLTLCTQGHRFARGPRQRMPRSGADLGPSVDEKSPRAAGFRALALERPRAPSAPARDGPQRPISPCQLSFAPADAMGFIRHEMDIDGEPAAREAHRPRWSGFPAQVCGAWAQGLLP